MERKQSALRQINSTGGKTEFTPTPLGTVSGTRVLGLDRLTGTIPGCTACDFNTDYAKGVFG